MYREIFMKRMLCAHKKSVMLWMKAMSEVINRKTPESFQPGGFLGPFHSGSRREAPHTFGDESVRGCGWKVQTPGSKSAIQMFLAV